MLLKLLEGRVWEGEGRERGVCARGGAERIVGCCWMIGVCWLGGLVKSVGCAAGSFASVVVAVVVVVGAPDFGGAGRRAGGVFDGDAVI